MMTNSLISSNLKEHQSIPTITQQSNLKGNLKTFISMYGFLTLTICKKQTLSYNTPINNKNIKKY